MHESPYLRGGTDDIILTGHTFSDEPGIYIEGKVNSLQPMSKVKELMISFRLVSVWRIASTWTRMVLRSTSPKASEVPPSTHGIYKMLLHVITALRHLDASSLVVLLLALHYLVTPEPP